jgi:hypothetical protein
MKENLNYVRSNINIETIENIEVESLMGFCTV